MMKNLPAVGQVLSPLQILPLNRSPFGVSPPLDTLAQLTPLATDAGFKLSADTLIKRAKSKYFTQKIVLPLADLKSPLEKYYRNAYYCNSDLVQIGQSLTGKYCNTRVCNNCNRIRTAKMINGYKGELDKLQDKYFVTLTAPNVAGPELRDELKRYYQCWRVIMRRFAKQSRKYGGIRKLEITYNHSRNNKGKGFKAYHPHFHLIINGHDNAKLILSYWLELNPGANIDAQNIKPVNDLALLELFKYSTKVVVKNTEGKNVVYINPIDTIMRALYGRRILQNFGSVKKEVCEDIEELQSQVYEHLPHYEFMEWKWINSDWINAYAELLTGYSVSDTLDTLKVITFKKDSAFLNTS